MPLTAVRSGDAVPSLLTPRLRLRRLRLEDTDDVFAFASDPQVAQYTRWGAVGHRSPEETRNFLAMHARPEDSHPPLWGIVHPHDDRVFGLCGFVQWRPHNRWAELGYVVARPLWGRGYAVEAARAVLSYSFDTLGLHRIQATCYAQHTASARVLENVNMTCEGRLRQCVYAHGTYHDLLIYAILRSEWQRPAATLSNFSAYTNGSSIADTTLP